MNALELQPFSLSESVGTTVAARQLGLTPNTIRKHLRRGSLPGVKVVGRWRVLPLESREAWNVVWRRDQDRGRPSSELVHTLQDEVAHLREQLAEADQERSELRQLVSQSQAIVARIVAAPYDAWRAPVFVDGSNQPARLADAQREDNAQRSSSAEPDEETKSDASLLDSEHPVGQREDAEPAAEPQESPLQRLLRSQQRGERVGEATQAAVEPRPPLNGSSPALHSEPDHVGVLKQASVGSLERTIADYIMRGWHLDIKLDDRAELAAPNNEVRVYLESQMDGTVGAYEFTEALSPL